MFSLSKYSKNKKYNFGNNWKLWLDDNLNKMKDNEMMWILLLTSYCVNSSRPPLSSDIIIFTDRPELKAKGERIIFEDREVKKRKFSLRETALFNPDPILAKISRILTENWIIPVNWPFFHRFCAPMAYFRWILDDIDVSYPFATFYIQKNWFLGPKGQNLEIFKIFN